MCWAQVNNQVSQSVGAGSRKQQAACIETMYGGGDWILEMKSQLIAANATNNDCNNQIFSPATTTHYHQVCFY